MELEVGSSYKFKNKVEWFTLKVLDIGKSSYGVEIENAVDMSGWEIGTTFRMAKNSSLFRTYQVLDVTIKEPDHIIYTPELINLYIEMALQTNDREWFMELTELKKGVVA